jgi:hypothetical protein
MFVITNNATEQLYKKLINDIENKYNINNELLEKYLIKFNDSDNSITVETNRFINFENLINISIEHLYKIDKNCINEYINI